MTQTATTEPDRQTRLGQEVRANMLRQMTGVLSEVEGVVVAGAERVPTRDLNRLRLSLEGGFVVVKNSLCRLALRRRGWADLERLLGGACGLSPVRGDLAAACRVLVQFAKEHEGFVLRGGFLAGKLLSAEDLRALAELPSREVLLSQLAGVLQSPLRGLAFVLQAPIRSLAVVLAGIGKKEGK